MSLNEDVINNRNIDIDIMANDSNSENNDINNGNDILISEEYEINDENYNKGLSIKKSRFNQTEIELKKIIEKIEKNTKTIEEIKTNLSKLKQEKNKKQLDIVNLLSKKETIEEVYKNQIVLLKKKHTIYKDLTTNNNNDKLDNNNKYRDSETIITTIINNSNEENEQFDISIEELKNIEIKKFVEQVILMMEEIFDKKILNFGEEANEGNNKNSILDSLKDIINSAYSIFSNNCSLTDDKFYFYKFLLKILYLIIN